MRGSQHILIVEDDERVRRLLSVRFRREGFSVREAATGDEMRRALAIQSADLILLDLMLPDDDGIEIAKELRAESDIPIVMLTGKTDIVDKVVGLEVGADDYVAKPYDERELVARVRTVLRRSGRGIDAASRRRPPKVARFHGWLLDFIANEVVCPSGGRVSVTSNEFNVLALLVNAAPRTVTRQDILTNVFGRDWSPADRSCDVLIAKLRRKLHESAFKADFIKTVRGVGYKFAADVKLE